MWGLIMRDTNRLSRSCVGVGVLLCFLAAAPARAQWEEQTLSLDEGWNSAFLRVHPYPSACDDVFGGEPRIQSVRRWHPRSPDDVQYDETAGAVLPEGGSWLAWFPSNHVDRPLLDLAETVGGAAYLIEVSPGAPVVLSISGRPMALSYAWEAGIYHFVGLPAVAAPPVNFTTFFAPVTDYIPVEFNQGGEIYRVKSDGTHERIFQPTLTMIDPLECYWIKAAERTEYTGPIAVKVECPRGWMDFDDRLVPQYIELRNETDAPRGVSIRHEASGTPPPGAQPDAGPVPLKFAVVTQWDRVLGRQYEDFPSSWTTQLAAEASIRLAFLPDALALGGDTNAAFQSILGLSDDVGAHPETVLQRFGVRVTARSGTVTDAKGLWLGDAVITHVARLEMLGVMGSIPANPIPVARSFSFRLLAHVDDGGNVRLLQRALVGTRPDAGTGGITTDLLADESQAAGYRATYPRAKVFRVSAANFPFMDPVPLTGGVFGLPQQALRGSVTVSRNDPVNPFRHSFAPLHDNKERRAETDVPYEEDVEVFSIRRDLEFLFKPPDEVNPDPEWGVSVCGGVYREDIYGLGGPLDASNRVIKVEGSFRLERVIDVGVLTE